MIIGVCLKMVSIPPVKMAIVGNMMIIHDYPRNWGYPIFKTNPDVGDKGKGYGSVSKPIVPLFCSHQNSWVKMDVNNPLTNGIFIAIDP